MSPRRFHEVFAIDSQELLSCFSRFLALTDDPEAGAELAGLYHPRALVVVDGEPRVLESSTAYADAHRGGFAQFAASHPGEARQPRVEHARLMESRLEADGRLVAWWEARERDSGAALMIATGFERLDGAWRLEWVTLADSQAKWRYADGRARMLADHEYAHAHRDPTPRSWIDLAYYRLVGHEKPAIATLPEARFSCGMSSVCCSIDYRITVRPGAQAFVDAAVAAGVAIEGETLLAPLPDGRLLLKGLGEACRFLDEHRHCRLHKAFGRPVFDACTQFPLHFANTPDGVIVAGSPLCGAVRANVGSPLGDRQAELQSRLAVRGVANLPIPEVFHLTGDVTVSWEVFRAVEGLLLEALDRDDLPLRRRLWLGTRLLEAVAAGSAPALSTTWETEPMGPIAEDAAREARMTLELLAMGFELGVSAAMHGAKETANSLPEGWIAVALKNMLFSKAYSYPFSLAAAHHVNVAAYRMIEALAEHFGAEPVPETTVINLVTRTFQGQLHTFLTQDARIAAQFEGAWLGAAWLAESEAEAATP